MINIDSVCSYCKNDMQVEVQGELVRLSCACGKHKMVNLSLLKAGKDTQPVPKVTKEMTEEDIHKARIRMVTEETGTNFAERVYDELEDLL